MNLDSSALLPLLVHIQAQLDGDLAVETLAQRAEVSASHLHRLFRRHTGETPLRYTTRLRLERAAFRLLVQDTRLLDIALDCGFQHPETFSRAFRRRYGCTPSAWRTWIQSQPAPRPAAARGDALAAGGFELSGTRVRRLRELHLAFVRHVGPYENVPGTLWDELEAWAQRHALPGPRLWLGIGHDAPVTTAPECLRFDAALVVPQPFAAQGRIGCQTLPAGDFAVSTHVGSFSTLPEAYATVFPRLSRLPGWRLVGLPAVEIYHAAQVDTRWRLNQTDICLPMQRASA